MTALAGEPGVDRPFRPEDITGHVVVNVRGSHVEVAQAPDAAVLPASHVFQMLRAGVATLTVVDGVHHLLIGHPWPRSAGGRVVYRLSADPRRAVAMGGYTVTIEGTRVA